MTRFGRPFASCRQYMKNQKNIFLMPCGAKKTKEYLKNTVLRPVKQVTILSFVSEETRTEIKVLFGEKDMAVWGAIDGSNNRLFFKKMQKGDHILFAVGQQVKAVGQIAFKTTSSELSKILWPNDDRRIFSLIYFIDNLIKVKTPLSQVFKAFGYSKEYRMQGLTSVSSERLKAFYKKHKDILSVATDAKTKA